MEPGWWAELSGDERDLRELAMHFSLDEFRVIEEAGAFYATSMEVSEIDDFNEVRDRLHELVALASGSLAIEFGRFTPPRLKSVFSVNESGAKNHYRSVSSVSRMHFEANARIERVLEDGTVQVIELVAPPPQTRAWARAARSDRDVADVLAILGREDVRWHDYHVFEIVESDVGGQMYEKGWTTKAGCSGFPGRQTVVSRSAAMLGTAIRGFRRRESRSRFTRRATS